ncbi:mediator complex subunit 13 C-terminal-domain-containing protein [Xylaria sp. CBS 124048]|nr:mediator complex subunit 13 C-terminal-domain-containing protein [Xylaria sp. CBS 124048]
MDTGDYDTNTLVVNCISAVRFAFYEPVPPTSTVFSAAPNDIEAAFRKNGYLALWDASRRGLWRFRLVIKDKSSADSIDLQSFEKVIDGTGFAFTLTDEGAFEPAALVKHRSPGPNAVNTPSSSASTTSSAFDATFRSSQSVTNPSFPPPAAEQDGRTLVPPDSRLLSPTLSVRDVHEYLLQASYSAVSSSFCARTNAVPLSARTMLLPATVQHGCYTSQSIIASFRIYLTTTGSLIISLSHSFADNLVPLSDCVPSQLPPLGVTILAAPLGMFATCQPHALIDATPAEGSLSQSPDTQQLRFRSEKDDSTWMNLCAKLLPARPIPVPTKAAQKWVGLQRLRRNIVEQNTDGKRTPMGSAPNILWPASLCFCKSLSNLTITEADELHKSELVQSFDPLTTARTWFLGHAKRESGRERDAAALQDIPLTEGQIQPCSNSLSPLALHRAGQTGAVVGGIYPTPPDGIQNSVGITPSMMDGNPSSPNNNPATATTTEIDAGLQAPPEQFTGDWEGNTETKRERVRASFESENLFGELGPDMFGDNDITEADFSFFDDQPDGNTDMPVVSATDPSLNHDTNITRQGYPIKSDPSHMPASNTLPTFAKPELRHARSSLTDETRRRTAVDTNQSIKVNTKKRPPSPFNPDTVFKRIRASISNHRATQRNSLINASHTSIFDKVDFDPSLSMVNKKYEGSGRFDFFKDRPKAVKPSDLDTPPTTDYLRRHGKNRKPLKEAPLAYGDLFTRMRGTQNTASSCPSPQHIDAPHSDADDMSLVSDQDDISYVSDEPLSPVKSLNFRRRRAEDDGDSLATSFKDLEMDAGPPQLPLELSRNARSEIDVPLAKYFADPEPPWIQYSLTDEQFIMAAQILTDQVTTNTMPTSPPTESTLPSGVDRRRYLSNVARNSMMELEQELPSFFHPTTRHQLRSFIEVQDVPLLGQPTRLQPRPTGTDQARPSNLSQISSPRFEMRRYETKLSLLPSSIPFWESLGLSPTHGTKDINILCVFPGYEGVSDSMSVFTERLRSTYESMKLGSCTRLSSSSGEEDGLFPFDVERDVLSFGKPTSFLGPSLQTCASKICKALSAVTAEQMNFVLLFVYSPDVPGSMVECCAAFNEISDGYKKILTSKGLPVINEIVLQLIPQNLVASSSSIPMAPPADISKLALEIYDRCTLFGGAIPSPAVILEQVPPRMIDFKLSPTPSASVLNENMCLHVGYAQSIDDRWVTAAWTDNRGNQQVTTSYCLGRKGQSIATPLVNVIQEIWFTTQELISSWKVHWRIMVAKCGTMHAHEVELWSTLVQADTKSSIHLTLVTVDTDPSLQILPPAAKLPYSAISVPPTPGSTPQGVLSPEQSGSAQTPFKDNNATSGQTPGGDNNATDSDTDATLIDVTDQTWGVVLSHRLHTPTSQVDVSPALVSGYLVKRGGMRLEDPPVVMEINIVHSEGNPRSYEALLRELLSYYRGLGSLARARGMVDGGTDIRPWHIAAAEKGVRALYMLM